MNSPDSKQTIIQLYMRFIKTSLLLKIIMNIEPIFSLSIVLKNSCNYIIIIVTRFLLIWLIYFNVDNIDRWIEEWTRTVENITYVSINNFNFARISTAIF